MEELTEVITAAEFHPQQCNVLVYSSSKGTVRLCDMRDNALCDRYSKRKYCFYLSTSSVLEPASHIKLMMNLTFEPLFIVSSLILTTNWLFSIIM